MNRDKLEEAFCEYKNGNEDAFQQIYSESIIFVKNIIFSMLKNKEDCENIAQDIFLKILKIDKENLPNKNWMGWLYVVTKNVCKDALKRKK